MFASFGDQLLAPFFFLLALLRQIPLTLFELIIWFSQVASCKCRKGMVNHFESTGADKAAPTIDRHADFGPLKRKTAT
ncbi:MAG: hypothetical protein ACM3X0_16925 [Bacteroidota bacterium]